MAGRSPQVTLTPTHLFEVSITHRQISEESLPPPPLPPSPAPGAAVPFRPFSQVGGAFAVPSSPPHPRTHTHTPPHMPSLMERLLPPPERPGIPHGSSLCPAGVVFLESRSAMGDLPLQSIAAHPCERPLPPVCLWGQAPRRRGTRIKGPALRFPGGLRASAPPGAGRCFLCRDWGHLLCGKRVEGEEGG